MIAALRRAIASPAGQLLFAGLQGALALSVFSRVIGDLQERGQTLIDEITARQLDLERINGELDRARQDRDNARREADELFSRELARVEQDRADRELADQELAAVESRAGVQTEPEDEG